MSSTVIDLLWNKESTLSNVQLAIKAAVLQNKARAGLVVIGTKKQLLPLNLPQLKTIVCDEESHLKTLAAFSIAQKEFTLLVLEDKGEELLNPALVRAIFGEGRYFGAYWMENLAQKEVFLTYSPFGDVTAELKVFADRLKTSVYAFKTAEFKVAELSSIAGIVFGDEPTIKLLVEISTVVSQEMKEQFKKSKGQSALAGFLSQGAFAPTPKPLLDFFNPRGFVITDGQKTIVSLVNSGDIKVVGRFLEKGLSQ